MLKNNIKKMLITLLNKDYYINIELGKIVSYILGKVFRPTQSQD